MSPSSLTVLFLPGGTSLTTTTSKVCRSPLCSINTYILNPTACNDYGTYLNEELKPALVLILEVFNVAVDSIPIKLEFPTTNKLRITQECQIQRDLALEEANRLKQRFGTRSPYVVSKNIFAMFFSKLNTGMAVEIESKISTYEAAVSGYNKALLSALVLPLIDSVSVVSLTVQVVTPKTVLMSYIMAKDTSYYTAGLF